MKRTLTALIVGLIVTGSASQLLADCGGCGGGEKHNEQEEVKTQTTCPVMGGKINRDLYVDHEGKRIYVCCKGCITPLQKDFATYAKKVQGAGETVAALQTTCPVMGGKVNKKQYADVQGKRIYVCCAGCIGTIKADPATYIEKLEKDGVALDTPPEPGKN